MAIYFQPQDTRNQDMLNSMLGAAKLFADVKSSRSMEKLKSRELDLKEKEIAAGMAEKNLGMNAMDAVLEEIFSDEGKRKYNTDIKREKYFKKQMGSLYPDMLNLYPELFKSKDDFFKFANEQYSIAQENYNIQNEKKKFEPSLMSSALFGMRGMNPLSAGRIDPSMFLSGLGGMSGAGINPMELFQQFLKSRQQAPNPIFGRTGAPGSYI